MTLKLRIAAVLLLGALPLVRAAEPQLARLEPQGGQRGTTLPVDFVGPRVGQDPQGVLLHEPGITLTKIERVDDNRARATLEIAADCPIGRHGVQLRTASGLANLQTFHVGALPEIAEQEPNSDFTAPQSITSGTVVNGVITNEDVDYFVVELAEGERLAVEIEGLRLGRAFFDTSLKIYNSERFEMASCDDAAATYQDAFCVITAPAAGKYIIEARETSYRGDDNSIYRLHVGKFPRPAAVYPPGGRVGESLALSWLGDGGPAWNQTVSLPAATQAAWPVVAENAAGLAPSPTPLRVVDYAVTQEAEPNDNRKMPTVAGAAPLALTGIIEKPGDRDFFSFTATKGQGLEIRCRARELRSPLDSVIRVYDAAGKRLAGNDDDQGKPDSAVAFTAPEDGTYLVEVEDHLRTGGEQFTYWIDVAPLPPLVELGIEEQRQYISTVLEVPQGDRMAAMLTVRRQSVGGDLKIDWNELPAGVSVECPVVPASEGRIPVILSAAPDALLGGSLPQLQAMKVEGSEVLTTQFQQRTWLIRGGNNVPVWSYWGDRPAVAVTQKLPFRIRLVEPQAPLVKRGNKSLKVIAERDEGYADAFNVRMLYDPAGTSSNRSISLAQGATEVEIPITANENAPVGKWPIVMMAEANVNGRVVAATQFAQLEVAEPYLQMGLPKLAVEQGQPLDYGIDIQQLKPFEGEASVVLEGLPPGVTTAPLKIDAKTTKIVFPLTVAKDARPGQHKGQFCRVVVTVNGEVVEHMVGYGELRIDEPLPPPQPEQTAQAGGQQ